MIYPENIKKGDTIGITATSNGLADAVRIKRLDNAIKFFIENGYQIKETKNVRTSDKGRSSSGKERAEQFMQLWENPDVKAIIPVTGGDFLIEMLSLLDLEKMKSFAPKWVQGFSDTTGLSYTMTTNLDIATIYGNEFREFGMEPLDMSLSNSLRILQGDTFVQNSFEKYQSKYIKRVVGNELGGYELDSPVKWEFLNNEREVNLTGRIIGGCFDCITWFIGTRFDKTNQFIDKYKDDGIIWFLESFALNSHNIFTSLWQMKEAGYFRHTKGIIFGRPAIWNEECGLTFKEAIIEAAKDFNIPIIIGADIGHVPPQITIINGSISEVKSSCGKGSIICKRV